MSPELKSARSTIASEIGADVSYFYSPDEKRFTGIEIAIGFGGAFLFGFFKGLASRLGEKLGQSVADNISERIAEARSKDKHAQQQLLEKSAQEVAKKISALGLPPEQVGVAADDVEAEFVKVLSAQAPDDISTRIAHRVRVEGLSALPPF